MTSQTVLTDSSSPQFIPWRRALAMDPTFVAPPDSEVVPEATSTFSHTQLPQPSGWSQGEFWIAAGIKAGLLLVLVGGVSLMVFGAAALREYVTR
jgi:hypothetical protein